MATASATAMFRGDERLRAWLRACFGFGHRMADAKSKVKNFLVRGFLGGGPRGQGKQREARGNKRPVPDWVDSTGGCYWMDCTLSGLCNVSGYAWCMPGCMLCTIQWEMLAQTCR